MINLKTTIRLNDNYKVIAIIKLYTATHIQGGMPLKRESGGTFAIGRRKMEGLVYRNYVS